MNTAYSPAAVLSRSGYWLQKLVVWGLGLQALWATYQSVKLILIDLPAGSQLDVNFLVNDLILVIFTALTSGGMAVSLSRSHSQQAEMVQTGLGLAVAAINFWLWQYLNSQNPGSVILPVIEQLLQ